MDHPGISNIHETVHFLGQKDITVTFCWSPGHVCIEGNELSDREAKSAIFDTDAPVCSGYYKDTKNLFKPIFTDRWTDMWKSVQNNKFRKIKNCNEMEIIRTKE